MVLAGKFEEAKALQLALIAPNQAVSLLFPKVKKLCNLTLKEFENIDKMKI